MAWLSPVLEANKSCPSGDDLGIGIVTLGSGHWLNWVVAVADVVLIVTLMVVVPLLARKLRDRSRRAATRASVSVGVLLTIVVTYRIIRLF